MSELTEYYKTLQKKHQVKLDICRETPFYFGYGMNADPSAMMTRTGDAVAIGRALLRDHAFRFAGCADVYPAQGQTTGGVLWKLTDTQFESLDIREGYPFYYDRKIVEVECAGEIYRAWMYYMTDGHVTSEPSQGYYDMLVRGYDIFGVDKTQIEIARREAKSESEVPGSGDVKRSKKSLSY